MKALARRTKVGGMKQLEIVQSGNVRIDASHGKIELDGKEVTLSKNESAVLCSLARNPGSVMLNGELLSKIWRPEYRNS